MSNLLDHLGKDTLPDILQEMFVHWCVWHQARPALVQVLERVDLHLYADQIRGATNLREVIQYGRKANAHIKMLRMKTNPLGLSAAEAATYEFSQLVAAADERNLDSESVAFFAARVCGWAAWAASGFASNTAKETAEQRALQFQADRLSQLLRENSAATA